MLYLHIAEECLHQEILMRILSLTVICGEFERALPATVPIFIAKISNDVKEPSALRCGYAKQQLESIQRRR
jgi:hypothetical protein